MASFKSTALTILVLLALAGLGVGVALGIFWWQARTVTRELDLARAYLEEAKVQEAEQLLATRLEHSKPSSPWTPPLLTLRFQALDQLGDITASRALAAQVLDPDRPWAREGEQAWACAHVIQGHAALETKQVEAARTHFETVLTYPGLTQVHGDAHLGLARIEMATGKVPQARERLENLLAQMAPDAPVRPGVEHNLGLINARVLFSREPAEGDELYAVQKGDTIAGIGRRFNVSPDLVMRVNHIRDPRRLSIGRRLKIPNLDLAIGVNKTDNTLTLLNHGKFFKKYKVRTGEYDYQTPVGEFKIRTKKKDPVWTNPNNSKRYAAGDPENQLGSRWMGFDGQSGLGIHEAIDPESIGTYSSNGCVGMLKQDVEELFDLVRLGTMVRIEGQKATPSF